MDALTPHTPPLDPWAALVRPNLPRLSWLMLGYLVCSSLFLYGLEESSGLTAMQIGLLPTFMGSALMATPCLPVIILTWYSLVRRRWLRDADYRAQIEREGMYAALRWWQWLLCNLSITVLMTSLMHPVWIATMTHFDLWGHAVPGTYRVANSLTISVFAQLVTLMLDMNLVRQHHARLRAETTQRQLAEARLHRLQAQLEPHMLFNTLANLHALIDTQPAKAQDMLAHLIDYLRATLGATRSEAFTLGDEVRLVKDYLALMQIRMGDRLSVQIDVPDELLDLPWPPMLLQPLVENAIQHGLDPLPQGGTLQVVARRQGQQLQVDVIDDGRGLPTRASTHLDAPRAPHPGGFGLNFVRERLATSHGPAGRLTLGHHVPAGTMARLLVPLT